MAGAPRLAGAPRAWADAEMGGPPATTAVHAATVQSWYLQARRPREQGGRGDLLLSLSPAEPGIP